MKETVANSTTPIVKPILEVVRNQFEAWRKRKRPGGRIPQALWQAAVEQCRDHSIWQMSRVLRLSYNGFKNRVLKARDAGFQGGSVLILVL